MLCRPRNLGAPPEGTGGTLALPAEGRGDSFRWTGRMHNQGRRMGTVILQRVVPDYRAELFRRVYARCGAVVATSRPVSGLGGLNLVREDEDWVRYFDFEFPDDRDMYRFRAPVRSIIDSLAPEVVISEFSLKSDAVWKLLFARHRGQLGRLVFWSHGWQMGRGFGSLKDRVAQYSRILPFGLADGLLVYSDAGKAWLEKYLPEGKVAVARNTMAVDVPEVLVSASIERTAQDLNPLIIVSSGRFTKGKEIPKLISLFARVVREIPGARLVLIGDGPERREAEEIARAECPGAVTFVGSCYDPEVLTELFLQADLAVSAGAVGLGVNHALAFGLPFVTFQRQHGYPPYHHPEYEFIIEGLTGRTVRSDSAFVGALVGLSRDRSLLAQMRRESRRFYLEQLNIDTYADAISEVVLRYEQELRV